MLFSCVTTGKHDAHGAHYQLSLLNKFYPKHLTKSTSSNAFSTITLSTVIKMALSSNSHTQVSQGSTHACYWENTAVTAEQLTEWESTLRLPTLVETFPCWTNQACPSSKQDFPVVHRDTAAIFSARKLFKSLLIPCQRKAIKCRLVVCKTP